MFGVTRGAARPEVAAADVPCAAMKRTLDAVSAAAGRFVHEGPARVNWMFTVAAACAVLYVGLALPFDAYLDRCDESHQSPDSPLGWAMAGLVVTATAVVAHRFRRRLAMPFLVAGVGLVALWSWWLITPKGSC